jgi:hypothetical protein
VGRTTALAQRQGKRCSEQKEDGDPEPGDEEEGENSDREEYDEMGTGVTLIAFVVSYGIQRGQARQRQGELRRAAWGLIEIEADGERDQTIHNIAMIQ